MFLFFRPTNLLQFLLFSCLVFLLGYLLLEGAGNLGYNWQWYRVPRYLFSIEKPGFIPGPLLYGLGITLQITFYALLVALVIGLLSALLRLSGSWLGKILANAYIETIRNTPLLVQIFVVYFVFAPVFDMNRFVAAVLALGLFEGAYVSEIIRAGIMSMPRGQWEAARALGFGTRECYRHIILPQALRSMAPPLTSQSVSLVKDSALVSTIAIYDLTMQGQRIVAETFLTFEVWITVALIYLFLTLSLSGIVRVLEWRLADYRK